MVKNKRPFIYKGSLEIKKKSKRLNFSQCRNTNISVTGCKLKRHQTISLFESTYIYIYTCSRFFYLVQRITPSFARTKDERQADTEI